MSVNTTPPISLHEIRYNFGKHTDNEDVSNVDRYVRDFNALQPKRSLTFSTTQARRLVSSARSWIGSRTAQVAEARLYLRTALDAPDRRADGGRPRRPDALRQTRDGIDSIGMRMSQRYYHRTGAVGVNGWFYASDVGENNPYECKWCWSPVRSFQRDHNLGNGIRYRYDTSTAPD